MYKYIRFIKKKFSGEGLAKICFSARQWDTQFEHGKWNFLLKTHYNIVVVATMLKDLEKTKTPLRVLDIGCGNGALVQKLGQKDIMYTGTDISQVALDQAKNIAPWGTYIQGTMDIDPLLEGQYDVIVFSEVLLYGDYEKVLLIHKKYLASGGFIIISLYDTWRTKMIWHKIKKQITIHEALFIKNSVRKVAWTVCLAKFTSKE